MVERIEWWKIRDGRFAMGTDNYKPGNRLLSGMGGIKKKMVTGQAERGPALSEVEVSRPITTKIG
jgi:hypothetical protein